MRVSLRQGLIAVAAVAWLFVVVLPYYLFHRPLDVNNLLGAAATLGAIAAAGVLAALALAVGHWTLRGVVFETALEAVVIQLGVGYGIVAMGIFLLTLLGAAQPLVILGLAIVGLAAAGWYFYRRRARQSDIPGPDGQASTAARAVQHKFGLARLVPSIPLPRATRAERLLAAYAAFALGAAFVFALTPPTGWDVLGYHLPLPKAILVTGAFPPASYDLPFSYPSVIEMLYVFVMGLGSDVAAQVIHWSYLVLSVGLVLAFGGRYFSWRVGWLASAFLVAVPSILLLATYAYNDVALMFYVLAAMYWTCRAIESGRRRDYVLAGVLAGMTLGEKYTAIIVPAALGAVVLFRQGLRVPARRHFGQALLLGAAAFALATPWLARNALLMGNPVYPFVFGGAYWDAFRAEWFSRFGTGLANAPLELLAVPLTVTVLGIQGGAFDATIAPLLLGFVPFVLLPGPKGRGRTVRYVAFVAAVLLGFWLLGVAQSKLLWRTRFLFPAFPLFALLAAEGWNRLAQLELPRFSAQRFGSLVIALVLALSVVSIGLAFIAYRPLDVLMGVESRQEFLTRQLGAHYAVARWVNENLPADARILSLWEPRHYYIERSVEPDPILDRFAHWKHLYGDADQIAEAWNQRGITHVLLFRAGLNEVLQTQYDPLSAQDMQTLAELEAKHLQLVHDSAPLGLTEKDAKLALENWQTQPYAVYELK